MLSSLPPALTSSPIASSPMQDALQVALLTRRLWRFCAEYVLGTRFEALIHTVSAATASIAAQAARSEIARLNRILNHRRSDTEIATLLQVRRARVSADLFSVLQLSEIWRHISRGAFDGRMGALLQRWANEALPEPLAIGSALAALRGSTVTLDASRRWVELSPAASLSLDAVAKGYIVDAALDAARRAAPTLQGIAINIGGEIRCWGEPPTAGGWNIGLPDPAIPALNAPLVDAVSLRNAAIATSGRGPRDRTRQGYRSTTISPFSGYPVERVRSATVVASHAADADAMATACMVLAPEKSLAMVETVDGAAARITEADGRVHLSRGWRAYQLIPVATAARQPPPLPPQLRWPRYWELAVSYSASDFGESGNNFAANLGDPYIAVWITDAANRPVTTLLLLGTDPRWARENFIWWDSWNQRAKKEIYTHSRPTTRSGQYDMEWLGVDEALNPVPIGKYILHFETSREHGKHTYRSIPIQIGREQFKMSIQDLDGMGSLDIAYKPYLSSRPLGQ